MQGLQRALRLLQTLLTMSIVTNASPATPRFHRLSIADRRLEAGGSVSISFHVPHHLKADFTFAAGQYLTLKAAVNQNELRRSYSICTAVSDYTLNNELRVAIKKVEGGVFSTHAFEAFKIGDELDVMTPEGRFTATLNSEASKHYVAFAAGSGITPVLSIMKTVLEVESNCRFTLVYGNRHAKQILFLEEIEALKNLYFDRVRLIHILSQQPQEAELFNGRITKEKTDQLLAALIPASTIDDAFVCGPASMIDDVEQALLIAGVDKSKIHTERFGTQFPKSVEKPRPKAATFGKVSNLKVQLDGKINEMPFEYDGPSLLDVALTAGLDLPFACKGGVCCTCRAKVLEGKVIMEKNYTLEQWEIDKGFVLTCQCLPLTDQVLVSFDER
jgi:ring-1,2-phenylacetyl-CoA epoxidase subunit PaaE